MAFKSSANFTETVYDLAQPVKWKINWNAGIRGRKFLTETTLFQVMEQGWTGKHDRQPSTWGLWHVHHVHVSDVFAWVKAHTTGNHLVSSVCSNQYQGVKKILVDKWGSHPCDIQIKMSPWLINLLCLRRQKNIQLTMNTIFVTCLLGFYGIP